MAEEKIKVGITQGDINGIGLEVILKTFSEPLMFEICTPVLFSSQKTVSYHIKALGIENFNYNTIRTLETLSNTRINLFNCYDEEIAIELGNSTQLAGKYALISLQTAADALALGKIDTLVTAPINKNNIQSAQFNFAGHTEYLDNKFGKDNSLMLMLSDNLKIAVVTGHIPLNQVASAITIEKIVKKAEILNQTLLQDFSIRRPKIAILGLNPHAGDKGTIGNEEQQIIIPAINKLTEKNISAYGPYSADGFFGAATYTQFDAVLALYHDQGLIPFKTLSFNSGVNFTAGLSIVRTSPDHGTAYELAGKKYSL